MKKSYLLIAVLSIIIVVGGVLLYNRSNYNFKQDYPKVTKKNIIKKANLEEALKIIETEGVIVFGFKDCSHCQNALPVLNDVAMEQGITKISFYDIYDDRENNSEAYQKIIKALGKNTSLDEDGNPRIFSPTVYFIKDGKVVSYYVGSLPDRKDPKADLSSGELKTLSAIYEKMIVEFLKVDACEVEVKDGC